MKAAKHHILVVDDDIKYTDHLAELLGRLGQVKKVYSVEEFFSQFTPFFYDLILLDLRLKQGKEGLDILRYIKEEDPSTTVIVISAYGDIATAVDALQMGAKTFLEKDKNPPREIALICEHILKEIETERRLKELGKRNGPTEIVGNDPKMVLIKKQVEFMAQEGIPLLLRGETGVGKHHIAKAIHSKGKRKDGPFVEFNPMGLSEEEVQKALFSKDPPGAIYQAHKGILVIGDIAHLPLRSQVELWSVLQKEQRPDFQLIAITERPIEKMASESSFYKGLFYYLKIAEIQIPPLRERKGDILLLARYFISFLQDKFGEKKLSDEANNALMHYSFPGNVAELKAAIETGMLRAYTEGSEVITTRHLPIPLLSEDTHFQITGKVTDIQRFLAEVELYLVEKTMKDTGWKKAVASKQLGYSSRFSMLKRVKKYFEKYPELKIKYRELATAYKVL